MRIDLNVGIGEDAAGIPLTRVKQDEAIQHVMRQAAGLLGGVTVYPGYGAWLDKSGHLVTENGVTFTIFTKPTYDARDKAEQLAEIAREAFNQSSVVLIFSDTEEPQFITANDALAVG